MSTVEIYRAVERGEITSEEASMLLMQKQRPVITRPKFIPRAVWGLMAVLLAIFIFPTNES